MITASSTSLTNTISSAVKLNANGNSSNNSWPNSSNGRPKTPQGHLLRTSSPNGIDKLTLALKASKKGDRGEKKERGN